MTENCPLGPIMQRLVGCYHRGKNVLTNRQSTFTDMLPDDHNCCAIWSYELPKDAPQDRFVVARALIYPRLLYGS